ncbi:protein translocase subunit SecD [Tumebacillus sp. ITR2]|uniref:Protein translocase subunit SecD n=1 Tax=Tumebacillus amylolyticus TaxID=2801339 RepID=A0ABS1JB12_9BACL|nr:protein translocase subunit SecD [Tumebacillus amylolyticus]MBL0387472.1 protein translocase subunit SecD [Tumebacillus amylolyticus]
MKVSRFLAFLMIVALFFALAIPTYTKIWNGITLGLDLKGGFDVLYQVKDTPEEKVTSEGMIAVKNAIEKRVDSAGITEPVIQIEEGNRIRVQIAGLFSQEEAKKLLVQSAKLEFKAPDGTVLATGKDIKSNAKYVLDQQTNAAEVSIEFKDAKLFQSITEKYVGQNVSIWLDEQQLQNPRIQTVIYDGKAVINGQESAEAATNMANYLNAGALPYPLDELSSFSVSPTLGDEALHDTLYAGVVAFGLIFVFMVVYYRLPGLVAMIALLMYAYLLFAVFRYMHITLTLPGLAALVLGIGMAVDVNIIAAERIKDEFRHGKSLLSAMIMGQKRSMPTIIDANITSIIAGFLMYWFGTGAIKSFAVAHIISVLATFLTAVLISRLMLQLLVRSNIVRNTWWYGAPRAIATKGVVRKGGAKK